MTPEVKPKVNKNYIPSKQACNMNNGYLFGKNPFVIASGSEAIPKWGLMGVHNITFPELHTAI